MKTSVGHLSRNQWGSTMVVTFSWLHDFLNSFSLVYASIRCSSISSRCQAEYGVHPSHNSLIHVLQLGVPADRDQYIHRLGRTGRKGKDGKGILILAPWEDFFLDNIRDLPITKDQVPLIDPDTRKKVSNSIYSMIAVICMFFLLFNVLMKK